MSDKARKYIAWAIKSHLKDDGASDLGAYRDVVVEVLKAAYNDPVIIANGKKNLDFRCYLYDSICREGDSLFNEEVVDAEIARIDQIPKKELPLHLNDEWETDEAHEYFLQRIKATK